MSHNTSTIISILSTEHGRMRREQRDISKRDLNKAVKDGTRSPCIFGGRWKIEYDGLTFIVDRTMTREVTAYASPLALADIDISQIGQHQNARTVLDLKPELMSSHTVLVIDNSGSMTTKDIPNHRCRQTAAYSETALEFIAEQLLQGTATNSDVVSLIEFECTATVVFEKEPISWVLYNKLLGRRDTRTYKKRKLAFSDDFWLANSNYLPALEKAQELIRKHSHEHAALSIFFLSDGEPTDAKQLGMTPAAAAKLICQSVENIANEFGEQFHLTTAGFANDRGCFTVLEEMAAAVEGTKSGANSTYMHCAKMYSAVGSAVSSLVASTTKTRTALGEARIRGGKTKRVLSAEKDVGVGFDWTFHRILNHFVFDPARKDFVNYPGLPYGCLHKEWEDEVERRENLPNPPFLALNKHHCGEGAERVAFRCRLGDGETEQSFCFGEMVAKETNLVERIEENVQFHRSFLETQSLAAYLANEFNNRLHNLSGLHPEQIPKISFLKCSVLLLDDYTWPGGTRGLLVEKRLDVERYGWCKWNDNAGAVDGKRLHFAIDVDRELEMIKKQQEIALTGIQEEDSESESDHSSHSSISISCDNAPGSSTSTDDTEFPSQYKPSDYLQAFTHFTYRFTNRKVLVCDLQGVFKHDDTPPLFELSDPAIHYSSRTGRTRVFGRTDLGINGIKHFFRTHQCNGICKSLELSRKNRNWNKEWKGIATNDKLVFEKRKQAR